MKVIMFPGQGSQQVGMGKELLSKYSELVDQASDLLGFKVESFILNPDYEDKLNQTQYTQPLLYLINGLSWKQKQEEGRAGDLFIGHSLGEYNALQSAGSFDFIIGLQIVKKRAELMSQIKMENPGGMAVVLGLEEEVVLREIELEQQVEVANYNCNGQIVLSGERRGLENLKSRFEKLQARRFVFLPVSGAFHSKYMQSVAGEFAEFLKSFELLPPKFPVYSNVDYQLYADRSVSSLLIKQIYSSVQWQKTIETIKYENPEAEFEEVGPGKVLTGLVKRIG